MPLPTLELQGCPRTSRYCPGSHVLGEPLTNTSRPKPLSAHAHAPDVHTRAPPQSSSWQHCESGMQVPSQNSKPTLHAQLPPLQDAFVWQSSLLQQFALGIQLGPQNSKPEAHWHAPAPTHVWLLPLQGETVPVQLPLPLQRSSRVQALASLQGVLLAA